MSKIESNTYCLSSFVNAIRVRGILISAEWLAQIRSLGKYDPVVLDHHKDLDLYEVEYPFRERLQAVVDRLLDDRSS